MAAVVENAQQSPQFWLFIGFTAPKLIQSMGLATASQSISENFSTELLCSKYYDLAKLMAYLSS